MAGKIFVHIGLPKTATTTLQVEFFPRLTGQRIVYLGVHQPRSNKNDTLYEKIYSAVSQGTNIDVTRTDILNILDSGCDLIFSDEMITVVENQEALADRFKRLAELLSGTNYEILVTVREPVTAMFSYYVEGYERFYKKKMGFLDAAMHDEHMMIFYYKRFFNLLLSFFKNDHVHVYEFEKIIKGNLQGMCDLISPGSFYERDFVLNNHNIKKGSDRHVSVNRQVTLFTMLVRHTSKVKKNWPSLYGYSRRAVLPFVNILKSAGVTELKVERPTEQENAKLRSHLKDEIAALEALFGIKY